MASSSGTWIPVGAAAVSATLAWALNKKTIFTSARRLCLNQLRETSSTVAATFDALSSAYSPSWLSRSWVVLGSAYAAPAAIFGLMFTLPVSQALLPVFLAVIPFTALSLIVLGWVRVSAVEGASATNQSTHSALAGISKSRRVANLAGVIQLGQIWAVVLYTAAVLTNPPPPQVFQPSVDQSYFIGTLLVAALGITISGWSWIQIQPGLEDEAYRILLTSGAAIPKVRLFSDQWGSRDPIEGRLIGIGDRCVLDREGNRIALEWDYISVLEAESGRLLRIGR
jgi:hypothetical protein